MTPRLLTILRDPRESRAKCSLTPLRGHPDVEFVNYRPGRAFDATGMLMLHPKGQLLSREDAGRPLLLVDCSWRRLPTLLRTVTGDPVRRRLPELRTSYPRRGAVDPEGGLASIEAAFAALAILCQEIDGLLQHYEWAEEFLTSNGLKD